MTDPDPLARRLARGDAAVGLITKMTAPSFVELGGHLGFDFVIVDTEHGLAGGADLDNHLRAADAAHVPALVRVSELGRSEIQHALDGGATGVVVPQVDDAEQARLAVHFAHYPPLGSRGLATSTRSGRQGTVGARAHIERSLGETVVVVQIESRAGVANVAEILAVPGVSAVWVGLVDLSVDLGHPADLTAPAVTAAIDRVVEATRAAGMPLFVIADTPTDGVAWAARGAQCLLINLLTVASRGLAELRLAHTNSRERISS
jgi:4-hydroxy-2-oxoheptanedioate aldolase